MAWVNPMVGRITSGYGPRWGTVHAGTDIAPAAGVKNIGAANDGTVVSIRTNSFQGDRRSGLIVGRTGNGVIIDHGGGVWTYYGHLAAVYVRPGQVVTAGMAIGRVGNTGNVVGANGGIHLHFEVHIGRIGATVNPYPYMAARGATLGVGRTNTSQATFPTMGSIPAQMRAQNTFTPKAVPLPFRAVFNIPKIGK